MANPSENPDRNRPSAKVLRIGAAVAFVFLAAGCARPEPHVLKPSEFDRKTFGRPAGVPGVVQVCYSAAGITSDVVVRLAEEECAKFGKTAQLIEQDISDCPMVTPVAAKYICCPTAVDPLLRYRCSAGGGQVERLDGEQVREALAAQRRRTIELQRPKLMTRSKEERTP